MRITKADVIWSYLGYIMRFFSGFLLLPIMLRMLSSDELGIWYVFLAIGAMTQMLDMGFSPTITRNVSYAYAGAEKLEKEGIGNVGNGVQQINFILLGKIKKVSRHVYLYISVAALFLLITAGTAYIYWITRTFDNGAYYIVAWCIYAVGLFLNFFYSYWIFLLNGVGLIRYGQQAAIISNGVYMTIAVAGLYAGGSIMAVAVASLFNGVIVRLLCKYFLNKFLHIPDVEMDETETKEFIRIIWFNAKKMGVVSIGAYLIVESNTLLTSLFFDLKTVAAYGLTMQVINFALSLARIPFSTYLPMLNELRITNNTSNFIRVMSTTFVFGGLIYWCCALIVIGFADNILILLKSKTMLLPSEMVAFMMLYLFLEYNHSNFASVITTRNEVPFVKSSIYSGIGVVIFSLFNVQILDLELWGLLLGQCFAQLLYNNWHWPLVVLREFDVSLWFVFRTGMRELKDKLQLFFVRGVN